MNSIEKAIKHGRIEEVKSIKECGTKSEHLYLAVKYLRKEIMEYLFTINCRKCSRSTELACRRHDLSLLKYLHENGVPISILCSYYARNNKEILNYLHNVY